MNLIYVILFQKIDLEPISNKSHYAYIWLFYHSDFIDLRLNYWTFIMSTTTSVDKGHT